MAEFPVCAKCGQAIQYDAGKLTETEFSLEDGIGEELRCERCASERLAEALLKADSSKGLFSLGHHELHWEVRREDGDPSLLVDILRSFWGVAQRAIALVGGASRRKRAEKVLERLVGKGGHHEDDCYCSWSPNGDRGDICVYCHARFTLKQAELAE
jgi:DNA-directed RNA polymerase subunit RPC12/RpoP